MARHKLSKFTEKELLSMRSDLFKNGFVLLNLNSTDLNEFELFTKNFSSHFHEVGTRQSLKDKSGDGYTTKTSTKNYILLGHSEGMYRPYPPPPNICFFMCVIPPNSLGGETTIVDGVQILNSLPQDLKKKLITLGVIYQSEWKPSRWQAEFCVETEKSLKAILNVLPEVNYSIENGILNLRSHMKAVHKTHTGLLAFANGILAHLPGINHPRYSELPVFFNPTNALYFGNGELFSDVEINQMIDAYDQNYIKQSWEAGDILMLDNMRFMHGRMHTAKECERLILSRFGWLT
jgi:alpha-ketoglutarate-dependent taurine dioxygenase